MKNTIDVGGQIKNSMNKFITIPSVDQPWPTRNREESIVSR